MVKELKKIICLTPVYNDWESFSILICAIDDAFKNQEYNVEIIAINDGSNYEFEQIKNRKNTIEIVNLNTNIGHQRAIAVGLQYINDVKKEYDFVIVLDADGEDKPQDIISLVKKCEEVNSNKIVFAQRKKREETLF
ncbi:MAG: glycosyltransferase, partial [Flavobacterium sp.]|nr:glycosyltransferase [Flavobacterium sp.]